jgi:uncharacterized protein YjbJ (UPF0337 family)
MSSKFFLPVFSPRAIAGNCSIATLCLFSLASCGVTKVAQCSSMSAVVNRSTEINKKVKGMEGEVNQAFADAKDPASIQAATKKVATVLIGIKEDVTKLSKDLEALKLPDEKLTGLQSKAVKNYIDGTKAMQDMITGMETIGSLKLDDPTNRKQLEAAGKSIQAAGEALKSMETQEASVKQEFNTYCDAKPSK